MGLVSVATREGCRLMFSHLTYSQSALVLSLVFGVLALTFGTRKPKSRLTEPHHSTKRNSTEALGGW